MPWFCYLLRSLSSPTSAYIGFTNDPRKRLRQHNGEIKNGARKTSKRRPWIHVAVVSGFPNKIVALQFEWQWQHPKLSRIVRTQVDFNAHGRGWKSNVRILAALMQCPLWEQLHLTAHFIHDEGYHLFRTYSTDIHATSCTLEDVDTLVKPTNIPRQLEGETLRCSLCSGKSGRVWRCTDASCTAVTHLLCACRNETALIPEYLSCSKCGAIARLITLVHGSFLLTEGRPSIVDLTQDDEEDCESEEDDLESDCSDALISDDDMK